MKRVIPLVVLAIVLLPAFGTPAEECDCELAPCLVPLVEGFRERGWLGAKLVWSPEEDGLVVLEVFAESPADRAGLERGDTVLALDGESFTEDTHSEMNDRWAAVRPGQELRLTVLSEDGERRQVRLRTAEFPGDHLERAIGRYVLGVVHEHTTPEHQTFGTPPE